ncbi:DUF5677 domain-containing protein [Pseudomonas syringae]|uniref:DUF5677 domain-containing protein n=1 Tax=Pseudomonas syringae TaxID=317 RepID=UPI000760ADC9|nr:DUF5677 domain-containing protein [Pseudomonas syringae]KWS27002.1 hypothetical protein AL061_14035 [Pseudomonas syringae pv. syringae]
MEQFDRREHLLKPHLAHMRHLHRPEQLQHEIERVLHSVTLDGPGNFVFATKVCCYTTAEIIEDVNRAILQSLKIGSYSAAESLSRTSLENSINLIFYKNDGTSNRPKSILLNYFDRARKGARNWHRHALQSNDAVSVERSRGFNESLNVFRALFGDLETKGVKGWPDAAARFRDAGYEHFYHVLFTPASDSIHSFSNDILNRFLVEQSPLNNAEKEEFFDEQWAEKISFAFYLATHSVMFYCVAASHIADRAEDQAASDRFDAIGEEIQVMLAEHEDVTKTCIDRLAPGMSQLRERQWTVHEAKANSRPISNTLVSEPHNPNLAELSPE